MPTKEFEEALPQMQKDWKTKTSYPLGAGAVSQRQAALVRTGYYRGWEKKTPAEQDEVIDLVDQEITKAERYAGKEYSQLKISEFHHQFVHKTTWSSNRTNALGSPFDPKSDEIDVESLWQVQPD